MLSPEDARWAYNSAWTFDHDISVMSAVLGDPVRCGRLMAYQRDGEGFLCGWPYEGAPTLTEDDYGPIRRLLSADLRYLHVWGGSLLKIGLADQRWAPWYVHPPAPHDWLMRIDLARYDEEKVMRHRDVRRAVKSPYSLHIVIGFPGEEALVPLVKEYEARPTIPELQKAFTRLALQTNLYDNKTICHLAISERRVVGAEIFQLLSAGTVVGRWGLFDRQAKGVADFLYFCLISYCRELGIQWIDLGYGATPTLFDFKMKWGINSLVGPLRRYGFLRTT